VRYPDGGWDARAIWNLRARALHRTPERPDLALAAEMPESHPDYPILLPSLVADAWDALGSETPAAQASLAALFTVLLVLVPATASSRSGRESGWLAALLLLGLPALLQQGWSQYADVPLADFLVTAAALAVEQGPRAPVLAGLAAGLGALTKNEGILWVLALGAFLPSRRRFALGAALPLGLLLVFKLAFPRPNDLASAAGSISLADPRRGLALGGALAAQVWNFPAWGLAGPAIVIALVALRAEERVRPLERALALALALICAIYLAAPRPVEELARVTLDRLLLQWSGVAVLVAVRSRRGIPRWSGIRSTT
jgi:hypothetical protein